MMDWSRLLSFQKFGKDEIQKFDEERDPFLIDVDRIIFSEPFRRLDKKTQVHPLKTNDNVHSRLPHSLEVASVGRSIGTKIAYLIKDKLPEPLMPHHLGEIMSAACLAHDIGNPPFGHAGEEAVRDWFSANPEFLESDISSDEKNDLLNFEGNAQALRILTKLEMYKERGGIRPTYAVMGTMMKYPWIYGKIDKPKYCAFQSEKETLKKIADHLGLIERTSYHYSRHPLAFLSEASDDICYRLIDLEDAHELGILSFNDIKEILIPICDNESECRRIVDSDNSERHKIGNLRSRAIGGSISAVAEAFMDNYDSIMNGKLPYDYNLVYNSKDHVSEAMLQAKETATSQVFNEKRKTKLEVGAYNVLGILLNNFCGAAKDKFFLEPPYSFKTKRLMDIMGDSAPGKSESLYEHYMCVTDYISGMTDNYAVDLAKQISGNI